MNITPTSKVPITPGGSDGLQTAAKRGLTAFMAPLTVLTFILGGFMALALKAENRVRAQDLPSQSYSGLAEADKGIKTNLVELQQTIKNLQTTNERLDQTVTSRVPQVKVMTDQLTQARIIAGLTEMQGPGIVVTLSDSKQAPAESADAQLGAVAESPYVIASIDIAEVLDVLKASHVEAFSINGERVIASTSIQKIGPAIQVNGVPETSPFEIRAIGDPEKLAKGLSLSGLVDKFDQIDTAMISIKKSQLITVPAYDGATRYLYAKPIREDSSKVSEGG